MVYYLSSNRNYAMNFNTENLKKGKIMGVPAWVLALIPLVVMSICFAVCYGAKPAWCCTNPAETDKSKRVVSDGKALPLCIVLPILMWVVVGFLWFKADEPVSA